MRHAPGGTTASLRTESTQTRGLGSESDLATCHGVTELGLVVDEGHDTQVGLNEQGLLQDQHAVGTTGNGLFLMGFLHSLHQLGPEVVQLYKITTTEPSVMDLDT